MNQPRPISPDDEKVAREIRRLSRRSFTTGAIAAAIGGAGFRWLTTRSPDNGLPWPLRRALEWNESVSERLFNESRLAPEFPVESAGTPRVNGRVGLDGPIQAGDWTVRVSGQVDRQIPLAAIRELPNHTMTTELKCVEGWSQVVNWTGVRLADFLNKFGGASQYVGLSTPLDAVDAAGEPDRYFVGFDRPSAVHPQTLLCFAMNGQPLTLGHGAPLRLMSSVKYGYKCIKRISVIDLTDRRPPDYWAQRGYDWYAGH